MILISPLTFVVLITCLEKKISCSGQLFGSAALWVLCFPSVVFLSFSPLLSLFLSFSFVRSLSFHSVSTIPLFSLFELCLSFSNQVSQVTKVKGHTHSTQNHELWKTRLLSFQKSIDERIHHKRKYILSAFFTFYKNGNTEKYQLQFPSSQVISGQVGVTLKRLRSRKGNKEGRREHVKARGEERIQDRENDRRKWGQGREKMKVERGKNGGGREKRWR